MEFLCCDLYGISSTTEKPLNLRPMDQVFHIFDKNQREKFEIQMKHDYLSD